MYTVGAARQSHVEPIVDEDARRRTSRRAYRRVDDHGEIGRGEVAFADLNEIDPIVDRLEELLAQHVALPLKGGCRTGKTAAIGDQTPNHERPVPSCIGASA
jgi:hypothetical protein